MDHHMDLQMVDRVDPVVAVQPMQVLVLVTKVDIHRSKVMPAVADHQLVVAVAVQVLAVLVVILVILQMVQQAVRVLLLQ
jgi:hypothetical protein